MKKLIFVDNDNQKIAEETVNRYAKRYLTRELKQDYVDTLTIIPNFWSIDKDKVFEMAYNSENVIITWSMYTRSSTTDSRLQILSVLRTAGISCVENCIYIDLSGELRKTLYTYLCDMDAKGVIYILRAIERNHIITLVGNEFMRLRVGINATGIFSLEPTDLPRLLK